MVVEVVNVDMTHGIVGIYYTSVCVCVSVCMCMCMYMCIVARNLSQKTRCLKSLENLRIA